MSTSTFRSGVLGAGDPTSINGILTGDGTELGGTTVSALSTKLYGVCSAGELAAEKAVTINQTDFALTTGVTVRVKFSNSNLWAGPTLNVNSTGAKAIYIGGAAALPGAWAAGDVLDLTYDGTRWNASGGGVVQVSVTLSTSWTGSVAPYTQTVTVTGVSASRVGFLDVAPSATAAQRSAAREALLYVTSQGANSITVTADGRKPTVSIPCIVTLFM